MSPIIELDTDRLSGLAATIESDATTAEWIQNELSAIRVPAITRHLVDRAVALAAEVFGAATGTAIAARGVVDGAIRADSAVPGASLGNELSLAGSRWWSRSTLVTQTALPAIDWSALDGLELRSVIAVLFPQLGGDGWDAIPPDARSRLISECPDLVAKWIPRGDLSAGELEALLEALACDDITNKYFFAGKARVPLDLFDVVAVADFDLTVVQQSDGTVTISVSSDHGGGLGVSAGDAKVSGSADFTSVQGESMTFEFDSMEEAREAIDALRAAAAGVVGGLAPKPSLRGLIGVAVPAVGMYDRVRGGYRALTADTLQETLRRFGRQLDRVEVEIAMARTVAASGTLPSFGSLAFAGGNTFTASYSDEVHGDDDYLSLKVAFDASLTASSPLSAWTSQSGLNLTGKVKGSAGIEYRLGTNGQDRLILTFGGEASSALDRKVKQGGSQSPVPSGSKPSPTLGVERSDTEGRAAALVVDIPIDDSTVDAAEDVVRAITNGDDPTPALDALYTAADITLTVEHVATDTVGVSLGKFGNAKVGHDERTTDDVYRKRPHGDWHSPTELIDQLSD